MANIDPLLIDIYADDLKGAPNIEKAAIFGYPWCGIWLKGSQGAFYPTPDNYPKHLQWFLRNWPLARALRAVTPEGERRYGRDWFRGVYHYLDVKFATTKEQHVAQAEYLLKLVELAGGFDFESGGDLPIFLDAEQGGNPERPGAAKIEDAMSICAEVWLKETGSRPIAYGNDWLFANGVKFKNTGCQKIVISRYTPTLPREVYTRLGCELTDVIGWQYAGTKANDVVISYLKGYPSTTPMGNTDITAVILDPDPAGPKDERWSRILHGLSELVMRGAAQPEPEPTPEPEPEPEPDVPPVGHCDV